MSSRFTFHGFRSPNYTQVPDELFDELLTELSGAELKVLLYIIRRTFGFKKDSDNISLSQMLNGITTRDGRRLDHGVGVTKSTLLQAVRGCTEKGVIVPTRQSSAERGNEPTNYRLNIVGTEPKPPSSNGDDLDGPDDGPETDSPLDRKLDQGGSRNQTKPLVGKSDTQYTVTNKQKVVNDVTANDLERTSKGRSKSANGSHRISESALRSKYDLTDDQIGRVHWLVEKQGKVLGHLDRNHAAYVNRAAVAVRDGIGDVLDFKLGDFAQAASEISVSSRPAYFHAMWKEEIAARTAQPVTKPTSRIDAKTPEQIGRLFRNVPGADQARPSRA